MLYKGNFVGMKRSPSVKLIPFLLALGVRITSAIIYFNMYVTGQNGVKFMQTSCTLSVPRFFTHPQGTETN